MFNINEIDEDLKKYADNLKIFDFYRLIDINKFKVYDYHDKELIDTETNCYDIWEKGTPCKNCSSRNACKNNSEIIKLEYLNGKIYLINSEPITINGKVMVIEFIKDITNNLLVSDKTQNNNLDISDLIEQMNELVLYDSLTGLFNRRSFDQEINRYIIKYDKEIKSLFLAVFDIDCLKDINDTYGHVIGDNAIKYISDAIKEVLSSEKIKSFRIGGDEFYTIFIDFKDIEVNDYLEKLNNYIENIDTEFKLSVSVGYSEYNSEMSINKLIEIADKNMYKMKNIKKSLK
ncbi:GGDEF domain-containing protein [uncultured Anaerofustis sp.]|uniref:GGDEF domain-containing protein n=1 Tax=uncultured Anaerofustis sp. TaxID=904996 RepID=UPI0025E019AE|nr:GGDEF domain-containing protein [uncultured Anaerofustis sp.]